jgi:predicted amidohydrolase
MPNVYACQLDCVWHSPQANHDAARAALSGHTVVPGSLIVLPEMFDVGFTMDGKTACAASEITGTFLSELARTTRSTVVAGHAMCDATGRALNQASVFDASGSRLSQYVKCHAFTPAGEHESYAPGEGATLFEWAGLKVAPLICYDLRFPEVFRAGVKLGAEAFIVVANWPVARVEHWITLAKARAIENLAYVVAVNRCGRDPNYAYPGRSIIIDPKGEVLAEAGDGVEVLTAMIDPQRVRDWRRDFPALRDARFL